MIPDQNSAVIPGGVVAQGHEAPVQRQVTLRDAAVVLEEHHIIRVQVDPVVFAGVIDVVPPARWKLGDR